MKKIIILNFETGEVLVFDFDSHAYNDGEECMDALREEGYDINHTNCQWMISDELTIKVY